MTKIFESDRLPSLAEFLGELAIAAIAAPEFIGGDAAPPRAEFPLAVSEIAVDLPFELDLIEDNGPWQLDAAPPTQWLETSVMPVLHRVKIRVSLDDGHRSLDTVES